MGVQVTVGAAAPAPASAEAALASTNAVTCTSAVRHFCYLLPMCPIYNSMLCNHASFSVNDLLCMLFI